MRSAFAPSVCYGMGCGVGCGVRRVVGWQTRRGAGRGMHRGLAMRVLIVKLSSLGDVAHALPVVHDIRQARPEARIDWVVEPAFAPLVQRTDGVDRVIDCALRRWTRAWWTAPVRREWRAFRAELRREAYDRVLDLQGLSKSALIARLARLASGGLRYGLANRTEGAAHEWPARWLVDGPVEIEPYVHALDRSRRLVAAAFGAPVDGPPVFGLGARPSASPGVKAGGAAQGRPTVAFVHGSSRADKLWPEAAWIELGMRLAAAGWGIALPHAGADEAARAARIAAGILRAVAASGVEAAGRAVRPMAEVWPALALDAVIDRLATCDGVIGVDSGLSHIAVALGLPHVQIYNWPTAWRTGPLAAHGHRQQVSVQSADAAELSPEVDAVWAAWQAASTALSDRLPAR